MEKSPEKSKPATPVREHAYLPLTNRLYYLTARGEMVMLGEELKKSGNPDKARQALNEALFMALEKAISAAECQSIFETLVSHGADPNPVRNGIPPPNTIKGVPLLMQSLQKRVWKVAGWILSRVASANLRDARGRNCLHHVIGVPSEDPELGSLLAALVQKGNFADLEPVEAQLTDADAEGNMPLHKSCERAWVTGTAVLLRCGANPLLPNCLTLDTPLHILARKKAKSAVDCAKLIIQFQGYNEEKNRAQRTPLEEADVAANSDMKNALLEVRSKLFEPRYMLPPNPYMGMMDMGMNPYQYPGGMQTPDQMYGMYPIPQQYPPQGTNGDSSGYYDRTHGCTLRHNPAP